MKIIITQSKMSQLRFWMSEIKKICQLKFFNVQSFLFEYYDKLLICFIIQKKKKMEHFMI